MVNRITEHIDIWAAAQTPKTNGAGRGNGSARHSLHGIKKLRELILELAVRGKLVPQDPKDEPASVLLKRIAKEKVRLVKEGKIKKQKPLPEISEDEKPFKLPEGWEWARLPDLYYSISPSGKKLKTSEIMESGEFPVVDQGKSYIAGYTNNNSLLTQIPGPVIVFGDHTTERKYIDFNFVAGADGTKILRPYKMDERYFYTYLLNYKIESRGYSRHFKFLNDNLMAIPPLAEQQRIVAKVDELMAICNQLEQQQIESSDTHQILVETLLASLTNAADQKECASAWQRIATHFDTLFTTEQSIDQLKQTILQLAVMGKLVPQNPNDLPASDLLKKIAKEKAWLIKEGKIKKQKPLQEISEDEKPFELPAGWEWVRAQEMMLSIADGDHLPPPKAPYGVPFLVIGNIRSGKIDYSESRFVTNEYFQLVDESRKPRRGDLLYTLVGSYGIPVIVDSDIEFCVQRHIGILKPSMNVNIRYLLYLYGSGFMFRQASECATGIAQKTVPLSGLRKFIMPIPPLSEQNRIVAKVDELMAICDALKARLNEAQTTQVQLADAVVVHARKENRGFACLYDIVALF